MRLNALRLLAGNGSVVGPRLKKFTLGRAAKGIFRLSCLGVSKGAHVTHYHMYRHLAHVQAFSSVCRWMFGWARFVD